MKKVIAACWHYEGIAPSYLNELKATATVANTVQVATGGAMVDGKVYLLDAAANMTIASAAGGTTRRYDRIVIRCTWAVGTTDTLLTVVAGTAVAPPAITQTTGTTYDILICKVEVNEAGDCTVTDERDFAQPPEIGLAVLGAAAGATYQTWGAIAAASDNQVLRRNGAALEWSLLGSSNITTNQIDVTHLGTMVPGFLGRQGGGATDWSVAGTTGYTSAINVRVQCGVITATAPGTALTFPVAFSDKPVVIVSSTNVKGLAVATAITASGCTVASYDVSSYPTGVSQSVQWLAIGPE